MLRGRKGEEVVNIYRNAQGKIKTQGEELARLRSENEQLRRGAPTATTNETPRVAPQEDPRIAEYEAVQYTDPKRAREIMREWVHEEAAAALDADRRGQSEADFMKSGISAMESAAQEIAKGGADIGAVRERIVLLKPKIKALADKAYEDARGGSDDPDIIAVATEAWRDVWRDPKTFLGLHGEYFGASAPTVVVPTITTKSAPPGARTVAPEVRTTTHNVTLGPERERAVKSLANIVGLNDDSVQRVRARQAARK